MSEAHALENHAPAPGKPETWEPPVPRAVRDLAAAADALFQNQKLQAVKPGQDTQGQFIVDPNALEVPKPATTVENFDPAAPAPPAPAPAPAPAAPPAEDWEQKFRSLQGRFDKEVEARRRAENITDSLRTQMASMTLPVATPAPAPAPANVAVPKEDVETFGEDLVTASRRWARAEVQSELAQLRELVQGVSGRVEQTAQATGTERIKAVLDKEVPNWTTTDTSPAFHAWLNDIDPFAGVTRWALFDRAKQAGDAGRVTAFFNAFAKEHTAIGNSQDTPPAPPAPRAATVPLDELAAPGDVPSAQNPGASAVTGVWTNAGIQRFYSDKARGKFDSNMAEFHRLEADLQHAIAEGRVR